MKVEEPPPPKKAHHGDKSQEEEFRESIMVLKPINEYSVQEVSMWLTAQGLGEYSPTFVSAGVTGDVLVSLEVEDLKSDLHLSDEHAKLVLSNIEFMLDMVLGGDAAASSIRGCAGGGGNENGLENERRLASQIRDLQNEVRRKDEQIAYLTNQLTESRSKEFSLPQQIPPQSVVAFAEPVQYPQQQYYQQQQMQNQPYIPQQQLPASYVAPPATNTQQPNNTNPIMYNQQPGLPPQQQHYQQPAVTYDQYGNPVYTQQQQQYHPTSTTSAPPKPSKAALAVTGAAKGAAGGAIRGAIVGAILPGMSAADGAKANAAVGALTGGVGGLRGRRQHIL